MLHRKIKHSACSDMVATAHKSDPLQHLHPVYIKLQKDEQQYGKTP